MKIMWTIAALACSVTLVNAQQSPRRPSATKPAPAQPAPAPKPRVQIAEPWATPLAITELELLAPGQTPLPSPSMALEALELPMLAPRPGQMPMALEFPTLAPFPGQTPMALEFPMLAPAQGGGITPFPPLPALEPLPPLEPLMPMAPLPPLAPLSPLEPMTPMAPLAPLPPLAPGEPMFFDFLQGQQGPTPRPQSDRQFEAELRRLTSEIDRAEQAQRRALESQDRAAQREIEMQLRNLQRDMEATERNRAMQDRQIQRQIDMQVQQTQREQERMVAQAVREAEMQNRTIQREAEMALRHAQMDLTHSLNFRGDFNVTVPSSWAPQDVADSVWRQARELVNRGEYGQAAQAFRSIPQRYPNSEYAPESAYYLAFSLFRIGGTAELREALAALEASKAKYPNARSRAEAAALTTRIQGVLANRGDAQAAAALRATVAANGQAATCDREDQAVQQEAMNQLSRMEGSNINELITRVLSRKDECAIPLRRTAVFLVGNRRDAQAVTILGGVARSDPSVDVRVEAIGVISRLSNEEGVAVLEELSRSDDERVQRAAIRALVRHPSARARTSVRSLVERDDVSEKLRAEALSAFDAERATADDVAWLRALYGKVTTPTLRSRTLAAIVRIGGPEVDQWLVTLARDDNQPSEIRSLAMRRMGESMSIPDLARLYDSATQQRFRSEIINVLGRRKEDAATDKLIDIVKNGTDPSLRTAAIRAISDKKDARANQLLLEIINK
jgi:TolA-binding protein